MWMTAPDQQQLSAARQRFAEGGPLPATLVPPYLARSWRRSRDSGLRPWQAPRYDLAAPVRNTRQSPADRLLYRCVQEDMEQLWSAFGGNDWVVFCANAEGVVLHARQSPSCQDPVLKPIVAGRRLAETDIGTTAPSCVINEGSEAIVVGNQHYLDAFAHVFCLSVPLRGVDGQVIGALDITGHGQRDPGVLLEHFRLAALSAEQRAFQSLRHCHLLHLHYDPRWLDSPLAGVMAVEPDGQLRAASLAARRLLGLPFEGPLREWHIDQLFEGALPAQRRRLLQARRAAHRLPRNDGSHLWVQHQRTPARLLPTGPARLEHIDPVEPEGVTGALQEQSLHAIARALREHEGNMAATARQLGISRTTLYAKLRQLRQTGLA